MKKASTVAAKQCKKILKQKLTVGLDLGDRSSCYCVLDESGQTALEQKLSTTPKAMREVFGGMPRSRVALETGTHSPWISRLLGELGHEVIVAHARNVRLIRTVAQQQGERAGNGGVKLTAKLKSKSFQEEKRPKPSSGDCVYGLAQLLSNRWERRSITRWQHRLYENAQLAPEQIKLLTNSADGRMASVAHSAERKKPCLAKKQTTDLTPTGFSHGRP